MSFLTTGVAAGTEAPATGRTAAVVANGAWCWFQDPRAVHHVGRYDRTYVGYVTSAGDIEVVSIDNGTGALTHTVLHPLYQADDHAAPGIAIAPNGAVVVFYSKHSGTVMNYRVSTRAEDISAFGPEQTLPTGQGGWGTTYANPLYLAAEHRTYLFFRSGRDFKPNVTSTTDFVHWTPAQTVVYPDVAGATARPYAKYATNGIDTILMAFDDGHPRDVASNSVYTLVLKGGIFRRVDGTPLASLDAANATATVHALPVHTGEIPPVWDGSGPEGRAWVHSTAIDATGAPVVAFATFPPGATPIDSDHRYHYARWTGEAWTTTEFARAGGAIDTTGSEPDYSGGMDLDHNDPSTLYASRQVGASWHVERWHTPDGGLTFDPPVDLTPTSTAKNVRPVVPWGPPGDVQVLWMSGSYSHWLVQDGVGYNTALKMLTTGPAPTSARISTTASSVIAGGPVTIAARRVAGWDGAYVPGTRAELWGSTGANPSKLLGAATADGQGLVKFPVKPTAASHYEVRWPGTSAWSAATTPSASVAVRQLTAVRISTDRTTVHPGQPVQIGVRVVNSVTGAGLSAVPVQLWQSVDGGRSWAYRASSTTAVGGLAHIIRNPTTTVSYQARFTGNSSWAASVSSTKAVSVR